MPPEVRAQVEKMMRVFPGSNFGPMGPLMDEVLKPNVQRYPVAPSPFYEVVIGEDGKPQLEEVTEPEFDEDEDDWGIPEEDRTLF